MRSKIRLALLFYGAMAVAALLWAVLAGRPRLLWDPQRSSWASASWGLAAGVGVGLLVVLLSRALLRYDWAQQLYRWFAEILGPVGWRDAFVLALLSSLGEELLFRGAMQPSWGLAITTVLFALAHLPPQRAMLPWTLAAGILGLLFGLLTLWTGNLAGAIAAHFTINLLNLKHLSSWCDARSEEPTPIDNDQRDTA